MLTDDPGVVVVWVWSRHYRTICLTDTLAKVDNPNDHCKQLVVVFCHKIYKEKIKHLKSGRTKSWEFGNPDI